MTKNFGNVLSLEIIIGLIVILGSFIWLTAKNDNGIQLGSRADVTSKGIAKPLEPGFTKNQSSENTSSSEAESSTGISPAPAVQRPLPAESTVQPFEPPYCVDSTKKAACDIIICPDTSCKPPVRD